MRATNGDGWCSVGCMRASLAERHPGREVAFVRTPDWPPSPWLELAPGDGERRRRRADSDTAEREEKVGPCCGAFIAQRATCARRCGDARARGHGRCGPR